MCVWVSVYGCEVRGCESCGGRVCLWGVNWGVVGCKRAGVWCRGVCVSYAHKHAVCFCEMSYESMGVSLYRVAKTHRIP